MTKIVRHGTGPRRRGAIFGVVVLALVTAALAYWAISSTGNDTTSTAPSSDRKSSAKPTPEATKVPLATIPSRLLAIRDDGGVVRAHVGTCPSNPASAQASFDRGENWENGNLESSGITEVLSLTSSGGRVVRIVGLDADCQPQGVRSYIGGISWEVVSGDLGTSWYWNPDEAEVIRALGSEREAPCEVAQVAGSGRAGIVLCRDHRVYLSGNGGERWSKPRNVPFAAAVAVTGEGFLVASFKEPECEGIRVRSVRDGDISHPGECLKLDGSKGYLAIAGSGPVVAVWAADDLVFSQDRGESWDQ